MAIKVAAGGLLGVALSACLLGDEPLPEVRIRQTPEPCLELLPPPSFVIKRGSDPAHCLPARGHAVGVDLQVTVSSDGHASSVEQVFDLCLTVGPEGEVQEPYYTLSDNEKGCVEEALRDWRFTGIETCWPVTASVSIGPVQPKKRRTAGESRGGPRVEPGERRRRGWEAARRLARR